MKPGEHSGQACGSQDTLRILLQKEERNEVEGVREEYREEEEQETHLPLSLLNSQAENVRHNRASYYMQAKSYACVNIDSGDTVQCSVDGEMFGLSLHFLCSGREESRT